MDLDVALFRAFILMYSAMNLTFLAMGIAGKFRGTQHIKKATQIASVIAALYVGLLFTWASPEPITSPSVIAITMIGVGIFSYALVQVMIKISLTENEIKKSINPPGNPKIAGLICAIAYFALLVYATRGVFINAEWALSLTLAVIGSIIMNFYATVAYRDMQERHKAMNIKR